MSFPQWTTFVWTCCLPESQPWGAATPSSSFLSPAGSCSCWGWGWTAARASHLMDPLIPCTPQGQPLLAHPQWTWTRHHLLHHAHPLNHHINQQGAPSQCNSQCHCQHRQHQHHHRRQARQDSNVDRGRSNSPWRWTCTQAQHQLLSTVVEMADLDRCPCSRSSLAVPKGSLAKRQAPRQLPPPQQGVAPLPPLLPRPRRVRSLPTWGL